jgi:deazaflavin-dependent oxidoreductase (nitroreductase family)
MSFDQDASGAMTYPARGTLNRLLFKAPLLAWRLGLGPLLGHSMLVLSTWGRQSRLPRHTMLSYTLLESGQLYVGAGWGERADWLRNLQADPHVTAQLLDLTFSAIARRVSEEDEFRPVAERLFETGGDSHFQPWLASLGIAYDLEEMVAKRARLHLLALDPVEVDDPGLPPYPAPLPADLKWAWAVAAAAFLLGWLVGRRGKTVDHRRHEEREGKAEKNTETRPTEVRSASTEKPLNLKTFVSLSPLLNLICVYQRLNRFAYDYPNDLQTEIEKLRRHIAQMEADEMGDLTGPMYEKLAALLNASRPPGWPARWRSSAAITSKM